jgi:hypothetical protein
MTGALGTNLQQAGLTSACRSGVIFERKRLPETHCRRLHLCVLRLKNHDFYRRGTAQFHRLLLQRHRRVPPQSAFCDVSGECGMPDKGHPH